MWSVHGKFYCSRWLLPPLLGLVSSCGLESAPGRLNEFTVNSGDQSAGDASQIFADSEDVVSMMLAPEKLADQKVSDEELAMRKASLMPLTDNAEKADALVIDQVGLKLAEEGAVDVREQSDLRSYDTPIRNQGSRPWCTAFATIAAVENLGRRFFHTSMDLSEIHHFKSYGVYQTTPSLDAGKRFGFIDESLWPYYGQKQSGADSKVRAKLSVSKKIKLTLSDVIASLHAGEPVVINLDVNNSFMNPKAGGIISPGGGRQGGHAIALTGVVVDSRIGGGGYFIIKNSWGSSWGAKGYGYVPFNYCSYSYCYAWAVSDIVAFDESGKLRDKIPHVVPAPVPEPTPNPQPTPAPQPAPRPTPVPDPIVDVISEGSFTLSSTIKDYRGLLGAHFFVLKIDGDKSAMSQVQSVTYKVAGYRDFRAVIGSGGAGAVPAEATISRSYKLWGWQDIVADATVQLKDGRLLDIKGLTVSL